MENQQAVQDTVNAGLDNHIRLHTAQLGLEKAKANLAFWEREVAAAEREAQVIRQNIKALGFHDIGHAKGELQKVEETK